MSGAAEPHETKMATVVRTCVGLGACRLVKGSVQTRKEGRNAKVCRSDARKRRALELKTGVAAVPNPATAEEPEWKKINELAAPPPFTLKDLRNAIPEHCWKRDPIRSFAYLVRDVAVVFALAYAAFQTDTWWSWPLYWIAQGTMFWGLFVVGHDCGHQSFSSSKTFNDLVGNIVHSSILVPYHGWRISHRTHHSNHGHVENDESWHPVTKHLYDEMDQLGKLGRLSLPWALLAYPFYLWKRSPGKEGSHYDPNCDLFTKNEAADVITSNLFLVSMLAILGACTWSLGAMNMLKLYFVPYVINVVWLDVVTYLHHHGASNGEKMPWYRGKEWSYLRGGLTTLDRDYGLFNNIHHDIGTHVIHHLFPQIPHYNLLDATEACKPVLGEYYREPEPCPGPRIGKYSIGLPTHLIKPLMDSFKKDHYVSDEGDIVFYETDPDFGKK